MTLENLEKIIVVNAEVEYANWQMEELQAKSSHQSIKYNTFDPYIDLCTGKQYNLSEEQVKKFFLNNLNPKVAFKFCNRIHKKDDNAIYNDLYPQMLQELYKEPDLLYSLLFKYLRWAITSKCNYHHDKTMISRVEHLGMLDLYIDKIYELFGQSFWKKAKRGYQLLFLYLIYFQEYFTDDMFELFIQRITNQMKNNIFNKTAYMIDYCIKNSRAIPDKYKEQISANATLVELSH